jgi:hypothetical protein
MTTHSLPLAYLQGCYDLMKGAKGARRDKTKDKSACVTHTMSLLSRTANIMEGSVPENPNTVSMERLASTAGDATNAGGCGA